VHEGAGAFSVLALRADVRPELDVSMFLNVARLHGHLDRQRADGRRRALARTTDRAQVD
jgi:hypothetical protein